MILQKGISQEGLKFLACFTMLIDHIGAIFFPCAQWLRIIGRISFPIYCFLITEGVRHTRNARKYGLRLLLVAMLAELPYDLLFYGKLTWVQNSVMVTLLLGFVAGITMKQVDLRWKLIVSLPFILLGQYLGSSYGMYGVAMIVMFLLTQHIPYARTIQLFAMILLSLHMAGFSSRFGVHIYAIAALIPISLYSGQKHSHNQAMQWAFTLFYPVHMGILLLIRGF